MSKFFKSSFLKIASLACVVAALFAAAPHAKADTITFVDTSAASPHVLQNALTAPDHVNLVNSQTGFAMSGGFFSGSATGADQLSSTYMNESTSDNFSLGNAAELIGDQRVYALLVDGRYDFNYDESSSTAPIHPYVLGGMGMARYDHANTVSSGSALQGGDMVPLFRVGGGVTYRLGQAWNMSLDYKAGFSGSSASDQVFTGRGQQPVDLQVLNMGMHYQF